ncbi:hypothetical protein ACODYM_28850 [Burkholderia gladioli]|uniref:hypothetical protein n=1 Tax=Burkholderia gladioli TaxID=28095 RepID=UPI003B50CCF9
MRTNIEPVWMVLHPGDTIREKLTGMTYSVTSVCPSHVCFDTGSPEEQSVAVSDFHNEFHIAGAMA